MLESIPPERNAPSGTSLNRRILTASVTSASRRSRYSSSRRRIAVAGECQVPVLANGARAVFGNEEMAGGELVDVTIDRLRTGHVQEREIRIQRLGAPVSRHVRILEQRLDFRTERDARGA